MWFVVNQTRLYSFKTWAYLSFNFTFDFKIGPISPKCEISDFQKSKIDTSSFIRLILLWEYARFYLLLKAYLTVRLLTASPEIDENLAKFFWPKIENEILAYLGLKTPKEKKNHDHFLVSWFVPMPTRLNSFKTWAYIFLSNVLGFIIGLNSPKLKNYGFTKVKNPNVRFMCPIFLW